MKKIFLLLCFSIIVGILLVTWNYESISNIKNQDQNDNELFSIIAFNSDLISETEDKVYFKKLHIQPKEENRNLYDEIGSKSSSQSTIVIEPIFSMVAYSPGGFYDYFNGLCGTECLTVKLNPNYGFDYNSSYHGLQVLKILDYDFITDADLDLNPEIIDDYDRVFLLHNEYVTKNIFDAISKHPKVIFLYPNALYAEISVKYDEKSITLIRGHSYPQKNITNGFDWEFDNTHPYEFDNQCLNWEFYEIRNGFMLNCYPEDLIFSNKTFLEKIRDL